MYYGNSLAGFSPMCCGDLSYVVIGHSPEAESFCKEMLAAGAEVVAPGEGSRFSRVPEGVVRSGVLARCTLDSTLNTTLSMESLDALTSTFASPGQYLEGIIICADSLIHSGASQLKLLKDAEESLRGLGRALAPVATDYTGALVLIGASSPSRQIPAKIKSFGAILMEALSGGFADGGADIRVNVLIVQTEVYAGGSEDDAASPVSGAIYHLLNESFNDRSIVRVEKEFLVQA